MSEMSFAHPWVLALVPLVPAALAAWWWGTRRARAKARIVSRVAAAPPAYVAACLFALAAVAAIAAAAQPRWGTRESQVPRTGADLVVVIDISRSMEARDVAPSRLQAAKDTVNAVMDRLGGDRRPRCFAGDARTRFHTPTSPPPGQNDSKARPAPSWSKRASAALDANRRHPAGRPRSRGSSSSPVATLGGGDPTPPP
jgi:hypothetical protein